MNLLERIVSGLKKLKETWITPPDEPKQGFVQLRTADGKTAGVKRTLPKMRNNNKFPLLLY